ncbi:hypothetical protein pb186bvf_007457 [Paramecium bursaria]
MDEEIAKGFDIIQNAIKQYEDIKQRNDHADKGQGCGNITKYYRKGDEYEEGGRSGRCGHTKDHRRTYFCQQCYKDLKDQEQQEQQEEQEQQ